MKHTTNIYICTVNLRTKHEHCNSYKGRTVKYWKTLKSCPHTEITDPQLVVAARCGLQVLLMIFKPFGEQRVEVVV